MGKQEDFVLRALEERDVRFVRLWFTDVLGYLKSVSVAPAELESAFAEGIGNDIDRSFDYRSLAGKPGRSQFWQMVQHVVNHASYHRGQVTTMLRQLGAAPAQSLDLIAFYRERG